MRTRLVFIGAIVIFSFSALPVSVPGLERLDRGLVAVGREDGSVFLSWRLLKEDPQDIAFEVRRRSLESGTDQSIVLTKEKSYRLTNFVDKSAGDAGKKTFIYELYGYSQKK